MLIDIPLGVEAGAFDVLTRARVLSTRGIGVALTQEEVMLALRATTVVQAWMSQLLAEVRR